MSPELVIFDCDGVLVDSEAICTRLLAEAARREGWDLPAAEAERWFPKGGMLADCVAAIEQHTGKPVAADFAERYRAEQYEVLAREVQPVPGVVQALGRLTLPVCVGSNGPRRKIETTLTTVGLYERFAGRIFSAYELERAKPFPDLYLHAAETLGADPTRCVVIEDSVPGVQAGVAAGMRVLGYCASDADRRELPAAGAEPFDDMRRLPELLSKPR